MIAGGDACNGGKPALNILRFCVIGFSMADKGFKIKKEFVTHQNNIYC